MTEVAEDPFDRWFAPSLNRKMLRGFMKRSDAHGLAYFLAWPALICCIGYLVHLSTSTWVLMPVMVLHGAILSFSCAASHECAHGVMVYASAAESFRIGGANLTGNLNTPGCQNALALLGIYLASVDGAQRFVATGRPRTAGLRMTKRF